MNGDAWISKECGAASHIHVLLVPITYHVAHQGHKDRVELLSYRTLSRRQIDCIDKLREFLQNIYQRLFVHVVHFLFSAVLGDHVAPDVFGHKIKDVALPATDHECFVPMFHALDDIVRFIPLYCLAPPVIPRGMLVRVDKELHRREVAGTVVVGRTSKRNAPVRVHRS